MRNAGVKIEIQSDSQIQEPNKTLITNFINISLSCLENNT